MNCTERRAPQLTRYTCTPICGAHLTKFIQVYLNGSGTQNHSPYQSEAMDNVYYWYGYFYVDNYGVTHQVNGME